MNTENAVFHEEKGHLAKTLALIARESVLAEEQLTDTEEKLSIARKTLSDFLQTQELLYTAAVRSRDNLKRASRRPYFTRVDFREDGLAPESFYIGRYGVLDSESLEASVIDWRAPAANLYYSGQIGRVSYDTPDGRIEGELLLKRQFDIEDGELLNISDVDIASQDEYLHKALNAMTGDRLKDIVTTIQAEQNFVIRYPLSADLVVQGVAGSGKTTIALHRAAYLLYTYEKQLRPDQVMVLAPSPLFLNFISGVLPDLGVDNVRQSTYDLWIRAALGGDAPSFAGRETDMRTAKLKGSLRMEEEITRWFEAFEKTLTPADGLVFGPVRLYTHDEMEHVLLVEEKPFPLQRRVKEFSKQLKLRTAMAADRLTKWYEAETEKRVQRILHTETDRAKMGPRIDTVRASMKKQRDAIEAMRASYVKTAVSQMPSLEPCALYVRFWEDMKHSSDAEFRHAAAMFTGTLTAEDAAPFALFVLKAQGIESSGIRHIIVDEAQDRAPLEFRVLQLMNPAATFTVVGDLMQGIRGERGMANWSEITSRVFDRPCVRHDLTASYRNTVEIMTLAQRIARRRPAPDGVEIQPVLRHGAPVRYTVSGTREESYRGIALRLAAWEKEGLTSCAVIGRTAEVLDALEAALPAELGAKRLHEEDAVYESGILLCDVAQAKGLEFDGVIIVDADDAQYPADDLSARMLYVAATRALHRLELCAVGGICALAAEEEKTA